MIPPSILPSGQTLKEKIVQASSYTYYTRKYYKALTENPKYVRIVPEIVFQDIYVSIGSKFFKSFDILKNSPSNSIHQSIAQITDNSNTYHFTTNFDLLVDKHQAIPDKSIHLHGSLNDPKEMTMRIYKIGQGVGHGNEIEFLDRVKNKTLFIVGYSGNDTDIIELINKSSVRDIYWLMWDIGDKWTLENISRIKKPVNIFEDNLPDFFKMIINSTQIKISKDNYTIKQSILQKYSSSLSTFEKYLVLGHLLFRVSDFINARDVFEKIIKKGIFNNSYEYVTVIIFYTDALRVIGESYKEAVTLLKEAYKNHKNGVDVVKMAEIQNMIGLVIMDLDKKPGSKPISFFKTSIKLFEKALESSGLNSDYILPKLARVHNNIGLCYNENNKLDNAEESYKQSISIKQQLGNYLGIVTSMSNLCLLYLTINQKSKYYYWRKKTMYLIEKYQMNYRYSFLLREEGRHYIKVRKSHANKKLLLAKKILVDEIPSAKRDISIIEDLIKLNAT